ncbi:MAG: hypothetical protein EP319_07410 [Deltaproteobacteria bacterium]|nr:MAG: hypothetical protein EP319_07410 [Deltaproteobacteria bacterium]
MMKIILMLTTFSFYAHAEKPTFPAWFDSYYSETSIDDSNTRPKEVSCINLIDVRTRDVDNLKGSIYLGIEEEFIPAQYNPDDPALLRACGGASGAPTVEPKPPIATGEWLVNANMVIYNRGGEGQILAGRNWTLEGNVLKITVSDVNDNTAQSITYKFKRKTDFLLVEEEKFLLAYVQKCDRTDGEEQ